jgi:hypothetical protein
MSAFVVSKAHIDYLVTAAIAYGGRWGLRYDGTDIMEMTNHELGRALWDENVASVRARYDDADETGMVPDTTCYRHTQPRKPIMPVQVLAAIACFEYQACEHKSWKASATKQFCESLRHCAISRLPGYEEADWEISA